MRKVTLLCVGRMKERFYMDAAAEYGKRLSRYCKLEIVELPETRLPETPSPALVETALAREAAALLEKLPVPVRTAALCVEGETCSSEELARRLWDWREESRLAFLIGGSFGLHGRVKERADWKLSLSRMTFPHHLARVVLLEQLYRAYQINAGGRYHK